MAIVDSNISICSIPITYDYYTNIPSHTHTDVRNYFSVLGSDIYELAGNGYLENIYENDILIIRASADKGSSRPHMTMIEFYDKRNSSVPFYCQPQNVRHCYLALGYDDATQKSYLFLIGSFFYNDSWTEDPFAVCINGMIGSSLALQTEMYELISGSQTPVYTWKSLEGLYGNQISLGLSQIKNEFIGDGSPVNLAPDTNIERLTQASRMDNIFANIGENFVPIAYAGNNYIAARVYYDNDFYQYEELAFFTADNDTTPVYSYHINSDYDKKYLQIIYDDEAEAARVSIIKDLGSNTCSYNQESFDQTTEHNLWLWLQGNQDGDSSDPYGEGSDDDGGDNFGLTPEDPLPFPSMPTASGLATGLFTVYNPTDTELQYLADFLWDPDAIGVLEKLFTEPENAIIAFYMLPVAPDHTGNKQLKLANANVPNCTGVKYLTDGSDGSGRYKEINFGSFSLKPKFDSYLDFNPYTTLKIYLPYIGVQNLNVDEFMCPAQASGAIGKTGYNNTFTLKYRIDLVTGVVSAFILRNNNVRYQFTGKCGITLPITGRNYDNAISGILTAVAGLATTVASGGATAPMVAGASATAAGTVSAMKERVYHSGNLSGEASIFAYDTPYLIITRPNIPESTKDTKKFVGLPSYKTQNTLSSFNGFTKVFDAHIDNVSCTDEEKNEILQLLKEGVII